MVATVRRPCPITYGFAVGVSVEFGEAHIDLTLRNAGTVPDGRGAMDTKQARQLAAQLTAACDRAEGGRHG